MWKKAKAAAYLMTPASILVFSCMLQACGTKEKEKARPGLLLSFGALADIQYCDADAAGVRHYRNSLDKLKECVKELNRHDLAFTIHLGDFIDREFASMDEVLPIFGTLRSVRYHALGNHDFSVADDMKEKVPGKLGMKKRYYDFASMGCRFVVLDGCEISLFGTPDTSKPHLIAEQVFDRLKMNNAVNATAWNGGIGPEQKSWLEKVLKKASGAGEKAVVFCHFPVFPEDKHNLWGAKEIVSLLESSGCVVAYISGHNHAGHYAEKEGIHYITLQGMVDTPDENAFAVIEIYNDRLELRGYGRVPSRTLKIGD